MDSGQSPPQRPPPPPPPPLHLSPRRELQLQGPRPSPLRISKDSHKIKKPPPAPPQPPPIAPPPESRDPVIIYTISPKVIHVEPSNFMDLVQRLTGPEIADLDTPPAEIAAGHLSPAAKLAAIHRTIHSPGTDRAMESFSATGVDVLDDLVMSVSIPGILSPIPASLPPISPAFFSPSYLDSSFQSFLRELSPAAFQAGRPSPGGAIAGSGGGNFWNSPGNFFSSSSPGAAAWDIFNQFQDF